MKPSILAAFAEAIPYIPGLRQQTGSVVSAILMMQLEYRFAKYPEGFYKFLEPPQNGHQDYKPGDSWVEELAFSKEEFRTAFDKIGVRYSSKTQYNEAKSSGSEFGDSYYCSYVDRQSGLTFYFRNHSKVDELISCIEPRQKSMGFRPRKTRPQMVDPNLREIGNPNLQDVVFSEDGKSEIPIYRSGESQFTDLYIDISEKTSEKTSEKIPPTPQGGMREISNSEIFVEEGDFRPEEEAIATPLQELKQEAHTCQKHSPPDQINVPPGDENHSRFATDTTAENMNTWNKIVATGAMKGERSPNPEFQEFYRQILSKTTQYKGRDCNLNHAKAALSRLWKQEPDRILAEAESWVKSKIKSSTSTQTRDAMSVPREERLARARAIQEAKQAQQQAKGA